MQPIFSFKLNHNILSRLVTLGKYDGEHASLTCATVGGKVFIHTPTQASTNFQASQPAITNLQGSTGLSIVAGGGISSDVSFLSINQAVRALAAGRLDPTSHCDVLCIGMQSDALVYDVHNNSDLFYKQISEGVECFVIGHLDRFPKPLAIAGGQCSIQGIDFTGQEAFWTVTGDNVSSMTLCPYLQNNRNQLIVGSEDYDIRIFEFDEIISELKETAVVNGLSWITGSKFGYSLSNGTVGVYDKQIRLWRIKSKNQPVSVFAYDINGDGVPEVITGWSSGKIDARNEKTGEVIFKEGMNSPVSGIVQGNYSGSGKQELVCCSVEGEIKGFVQSETCEKTLLDNSSSKDSVRELLQRKHNLLLELKNYGDNFEASNKLKSGDIKARDIGVIPANTQLQTMMTVSLGDDKQRPHVQLTMKTSNETIIRSVIIFAEGIFPGESHVIHPNMQTVNSSVVIPLFPSANTPLDFYIKALIGYRTSHQYHVFELSRQLPKFSMFLLNTGQLEGLPTEEPSSYVTFILTERVNRLVMWINKNFLLSEDIPEDKLDVTFFCLRGSGNLVIRAQSNHLGQKITIKTADIILAGELIQSILEFVGLAELDSQAHFPDVFSELAALVSKVTEFHETTNRLNSDVADDSNMIRSLIVKAEDSRLLRDWKTMKNSYSEVHTRNMGLIAAYKIRCANHNELMSMLKIVNQIIQKASNLRAGKFKTEVVNAGRTAIKTCDINPFAQYLSVAGEL